MTGNEREELARQLLETEKKSGKGNVKWHQTREATRHAYIRAVFNNPLLKGKITYYPVQPAYAS